MPESRFVDPSALRSIRRGNLRRTVDGFMSPRTPGTTGTGTGNGSNIHASARSPRPGLQRLHRTSDSRRRFSSSSVASSSVSQQRVSSLSIQASEISTSTPASVLNSLSLIPSEKRPAAAAENDNDDDRDEHDLSLEAPNPKRLRTGGLSVLPSPEITISLDGESYHRPRAVSISSGSDTSIPAQLPTIKKENVISRPTFSPTRRKTEPDYNRKDASKTQSFESIKPQSTAHQNTPYGKPVARKGAVKSQAILIKSEEASDDDGADSNSFVALKDPPAIAKTGSRPYRSWPDKDGKLRPTYGALLPDRYPAPVDPRQPWSCPVRGCISSCKTLQGLGCHFSNLHRAKLYNDCQDGTLTEVGVRVEADSKGCVGAIIVSTNPILPLNPSITPQTIKETKASPPANPTSSSTMPSGNPWKSLFEKAKARSDSWQHIAPALLAFQGVAILSKGEQKVLLYLLSLPRQRDLPMEWADALQNAHQRGGVKAATAMLIHVTGEKGLCNNCSLNGAIQCDNCVALPNAPKEIRDLLESSCCNCYYYNACRPCAFVTHQNKGVIKAEPPGVHIAEETSATKLIPQQIPKLDSPPLQHPLVQSFNHEKVEETEAGVLSHRPSISPTRLAETMDSSHRSTPAESSEPRVIHPSLMIPTNGMGMEDWEFAPGRRVVESDNGVDNVAFSASYLTSNQGISVGPNTTIQVLTLRPGVSQTLSSDPIQTRFCSVSSGKVKIKLDTHDEEEFFIGHRGVFTVHRGNQCTVENWFYEEATITIFSTAVHE